MYAITEGEDLVPIVMIVMSMSTLVQTKKHESLFVHELQIFSFANVQNSK